jgi:hypothetical protein
MVSTNPMFRNTPTNQERNKMRNSGMDLNAVRDITGRTSDFRTPYPSFNPLDRAGQLQRGAVDDYSAERMAGGTGAAPMDRINQLQPLAFAEDNTTFVDGKAYSRGLGQGSPQPTAQPGGYRARMAPKEPDPFAPGAGYQATDPSDPYYSKRPRKPMRLAEGGLFSMPMPGYAMGGPVMRNPYDRGMTPTIDEVSADSGGKPFAMSHSGDPMTGPFRDYYKKMSLKDRMVGGAGVNPFSSPNQGYAEGGPVEGPGGPKDDLINAKLSDGEFVMSADAVKFHGLDRLYKMMAKAKEGLAEIKPAPQALPTPLPVTMPQPTPAFAYGGMAQSMPVPGYAEGGLKIPEELDQSLYRAIQANARAQYDNTGPIAMMGLGVGPRGDAGIASSQAASSATQQAMEEVDRFLAAQDDFNRLSDEQSAARQTRIRNMTSPEWLKNNPEWLASAAQQIEDEQGPMAGPQRLTAVVGDQAYGPTMTDSPAFQPRPAAPAVAAPAVAAMQQPQNIIRRLPPNPYSVETGYSLTPMASSPQVSPFPSPQVPAPAMANGRQPQPVLSSPMDTNKPATMPSGYPRPAFLSPSEKDAQEKEKWSAYGANRVAPAGFEIALTGLTGMQKRNARRALAMEEATFQRNQGRAAIEQANIDARDAAKQSDADRRAADATAAAQEWWKQQQQIGQNFDMARENRNINNAAALNAAEQDRADQRALMEAQQKAQADAAARQITMQPIPGTPGYNVAMMGGSRVPGTPLMQAQTTPGPFREGLGRTTYTPMEDPATAPKPPTVRKSAPRPGATKEAPEWEYATMSDNTTRPITIENPRPDQMSERFKHQYGKAPQTEADWTDAYYLTTGQPRPKTTAAAAPAAGTAAPRAKIKTVTPVS